jgi:hypothetical protein
MIGTASGILNSLKNFGRDAGVMSRGLKLLEERLAEEKQSQRRVDKLRQEMREGRTGRIAKK